LIWPLLMFAWLASGTREKGRQYSQYIPGRAHSVNVKSIMKGALLLFVLGSLIVLLVKETSQSARTSSSDAQGRSADPTSVTESKKVIAYYFHTTYRCPTCRRIEAYSKEAIDFGFAQELKDGRLEWRLINVELPQNQHFAQDYKLFTKSLVLVRMKDGKQVEWTNLSRVWELTGEHAAFLRYVQQEIRAYLEKN
jgi:hypothetical protein